MYCLYNIGNTQLFELLPLVINYDREEPLRCLPALDPSGRPAPWNFAHAALVPSQDICRRAEKTLNVAFRTRLIVSARLAGVHVELGCAIVIVADRNCLH